MPESDYKNPLEYIASEEFGQLIKDNIIKFKETNGIEHIDEQQAKYFQDRFLQDMDFDGSNIILIHFQKRVLEIIASFSGDTTFHMGMKEYLEVVERAGFRKIAEFENEKLERENASENNIEYFKNLDQVEIRVDEKEDGSKDLYCKEKEYLFYQDHTGALLHVDSYHGKRNGSDMFFQGKMRKPRSEIYGFTCNYAAPNAYKMKIDVREMLLQRMSEAAEHFEFVKEWKDCDDLFLHSSVTKEMEFIDKLRVLPNDVLENMLASNVLFLNGHRELLEERGIEVKNKELRSEIESALRSMDQDTVDVYLVLYDGVVRTEELISDSVYEDLEARGFARKDIEDYTLIAQSLFGGYDEKYDIYLSPVLPSDERRIALRDKMLDEVNSCSVNRLRRIVTSSSVGYNDKNYAVAEAVIDRSYREDREWLLEFVKDEPHRFSFNRNYKEALGRHLEAKNKPKAGLH